MRSMHLKRSFGASITTFRNDAYDGAALSSALALLSMTYIWAARTWVVRRVEKREQGA
jgi:hypothetical protein